MAQLEICGNCRFWKRIDDTSLGSYGMCRINPPVVFEDHIHHDTYSAWPDTQHGAWCGKFEVLIKGEHVHE